jgi:hypothetical protein
MVGKTANSLGLVGFWGGGVAGERTDGDLHRFVAFAGVEMRRGVPMSVLAPAASWSRSRVVQGERMGMDALWGKARRVLVM